MSEQKETIYAGNGRQVTGTYGTFRSVSICLSDLPKEHITESKNGKKYIKLNINDKQEKDQYGNDVVATVDTWKPDPNYKSNGNNQQNNTEASKEMDDIPF